MDVAALSGKLFAPVASLGLAAAAVLAPVPAAALEPFYYSIGVPNVPSTSLIDVTARDLGLWQASGLEPREPPAMPDRRNWTPEAENSPDVRMYGMGAAINYMSKGVDFVIVADLGARAEWHMWTLSSSPIRQAADVKGKRIAVTQLSGTDRLYADVFLNSLGLAPKDITYVPTGGLPQNYAALGSGTADIWVTTEHAAALIDRDRRLRSVAMLSTYLGDDWDPYVILASRTALTERPEMVRKAVGVLLQAAAYVTSHRDDDIARLMVHFHVDRPTAERLFGMVHIASNGALHLDRIKRMRDYYIAHGIIAPEKAPPLDKMFSDAFVGVVR